RNRDTIESPLVSDHRVIPPVAIMSKVGVCRKERAAVGRDGAVLRLNEKQGYVCDSQFQSERRAPAAHNLKLVAGAHLCRELRKTGAWSVKEIPSRPDHVRSLIDDQLSETGVANRIVP